MFLMPDSLAKTKKIRNFDSCDVIGGTEVLYSIIWDSDLINIKVGRKGVYITRTCLHDNYQNWSYRYLNC